MARILPSDRGPGARAANAIGYADWLLHQRSFQGHDSCLRAGLEVLNELTTRTRGRRFVDCSAQEQDLALTRIQSIPHPGIQRFFLMLVRMTLAGFLCPPEYGGNRDGLGWRTIGFVPDDGPPSAPAAGPDGRNGSEAGT